MSIEVWHFCIIHIDSCKDTTGVRMMKIEPSVFVTCRDE